MPAVLNLLSVARRLTVAYKHLALPSADGSLRLIWREALDPRAD